MHAAAYSAVPAFSLTLWGLSTIIMSIPFLVLQSAGAAMCMSCCMSVCSTRMQRNTGRLHEAQVVRQWMHPGTLSSSAVSTVCTTCTFQLAWQRCKCPCIASQATHAASLFHVQLKMCKLLRPPLAEVLLRKLKLHCMLCCPSTSMLKPIHYLDVRDCYSHDKCLTCDPS